MSLEANGWLLIIHHDGIRGREVMDLLAQRLCMSQNPGNQPLEQASSKACSIVSSTCFQSLKSTPEVHCHVNLNKHSEFWRSVVQPTHAIMAP